MRRCSARRRWPWRGAAGAAVPAFALALALMRVASLAPTWAAYDADLRQARATIAALPEGERVLAILPAIAKLTAEA